MANKNFSKYLWEMWDISGANKQDVGVGRDMFWANLENYGNPEAEYYSGADALNWHDLAEDWKALTQEEQWEQKIICGWVSRKYYGKLCTARRAKDRNEWEKIVAHGVVEYHEENKCDCDVKDYDCEICEYENCECEGKKHEN